MPAVADRLPPGLLPEPSVIRTELERVEEQAEVLRRLLRLSMRARVTPEVRQRLAEATREGRACAH
jgi:hypothetical protein